MADNKQDNRGNALVLVRLALLAFRKRTAFVAIATMSALLALKTYSRCFGEVEL